MKFVHMSDIHLGTPGMLIEGIDPHARLARAFGHIAEHHNDANCVVISGDLTHWADPEAYQALKQALKIVPVPVKLMVGDHDARDAFLTAFPDHPRDMHGFVNHVHDTPDARFIFCDTAQPRSGAGHFCLRRRTWLAAQLETASRAFVFFHHNPLHLGAPSSDMLSIVDADQAPLRALLKAHQDRIGHIFFGHVHEPLCGTLAGVPFSGVPATVHQAIPNLSESDASAMGPLEPSYRVVLLRGEDLVIHQIPFGWEGEVVYRGNDGEDWAKRATTGA